jgi:hypothetical protein
MSKHVTTAAAFLASGLFAIASVGVFAEQGRPSAPPGQTNRPASPPGKTSAPPQTPPGQAKPPQTPPGQAKPATPPGQTKAAAPIIVKPALAANLQPLLPGTTVAVAAQGFETLGAFVSAVHVSHNLEIPFASLKTRIVDEGMSLGSAIQSFKTTANVKTEVARAEKQAKDTIAKGDAP